MEKPCRAIQSLQKQQVNETALTAYVWENNLQETVGGGGSTKHHLENRMTEKECRPNGKYRVFLLEKSTIMPNNDPNTLNVRSEIYKRCPYRDKNALRNC